MGSLKYIFLFNKNLKNEKLFYFLILLNQKVLTYLEIILN